MVKPIPVFGDAPAGTKKEKIFGFQIKVFSFPREGLPQGRGKPGRELVKTQPLIGHSFPRIDEKPGKGGKSFAVRLEAQTARLAQAGD